MSLTPAQLDQFYRDGYIIVPDLFTADEMDAALAAMEQIFYGQSFQQWLSDSNRGDAALGSRTASPLRTTTPRAARNFPWVRQPWIG